MDDLLPIITTYVIRIAGVIALFVFSWIVAGYVRRAVTRGLQRAKFDETLTTFLANVTRWAILLMALLACLGVFGVETTSFAAVIGAAGLAVGLAFQGSLSNVASGTMLLIFRPFKVGDVVAVAGHTGKVSEIGLFTTELNTPDNRHIILPNSLVFSSTIENVTYNETRRVDVAVGCDYAASLDETRRVLEAAVATVEPKLTTPAAQVVLTGLGDSAVNWQVRIWCKTSDYFVTLERATQAVKDGLDEAKIGIPFPQVQVHMDKAA